MMLDEELLGYCEIHCKTERAMFNSDQINRIAKLAGEKGRVPKGWYSMHEEMQELVDEARARKELEHDPKEP